MVPSSPFNPSHPFSALDEPRWLRPEYPVQPLSWSRPLERVDNGRVNQEAGLLEFPIRLVRLSPR